MSMKGKIGTNMQGPFKAMPVGRVLARIANHMQPEKRAIRKTTRDDIARLPKGKRKLTEDQVRAMRREYKPRVTTHKMLGEKYGCHPMEIASILEGSSYGWVK